MRVNWITIRNYKGFSDSGSIKLSPSWNVVIGQNNVGKTALLECLTPRRFGNHPHKNVNQDEDFVRPDRSEVDISVRLTGKEAKTLILRTGSAFEFPIPLDARPSPKPYVDEIFAQEKIDVQARALGSNAGFQLISRPAHGLFINAEKSNCVRLTVTQDKKIHVGEVINNNSDSFPELIRSHVDSYLFRFNAERFSLARCNVDVENTLRSNAENLASVLQILSANPSKYEKFNEHIRDIFPSVQWVSSVPIDGNRCEIRVWNASVESARSDLAIPLSECGTGLGQVLAIIYVAMTHPAGLIIIDEPNSFLHPGAAKKLVQILKNYSQHQYVISTHSPELLSTCQPAKLHVVTMKDGISSVQSFDDTTIDDQRMMLSEIGVSLSDILSSERIIWVEGPTEKECFELIAKSKFPHRLIGTSFVPVRNTGDLQGRERTARAVLDIYDQLSKGGAVLPADVRFSFDSEGKTAADLEELNRRCGGRANFLPRRMTESYLLDPKAISETLKALGEDDATHEKIYSLIDSISHKYTAGSKSNDDSAEILRNLDGARLLGDVFSEASEARHEYRKVRDASEILRRMIKAGHGDVDELTTYVESLLSLSSE